jgi:hypothetical protein
MARFLVQSRLFLGNQHAMWSKQHNGKVSPRQLWRDLSHLSAHSRYTTIGDAGERCVLEVSPLQLVAMCTASNYLLAIISILW